jgi:hypothetical protein
MEAHGWRSEQARAKEAISMVVTHEPKRDEERDEKAYQAAEKRAEELQGFYVHLLVYAVVNGGLFAINLLSRDDGGTWWFYWPLVGWGLGLIIHALATFGGVFSEGWKNRKAAELYDRAARDGR